MIGIDAPLLCGGFPVCHRYANWRKSLLYSFPLSPSSSGQGRHPFKVDITGSNPVGGTIQNEKPVANSVMGFLLSICRDSNPTGCGAEETRSVFQRSTQGAKRRSGSGRRQPHADIPLGAPFEMKSPLPKAVTGFLLSICRESNPTGRGLRSPPKASGQKMANMSTVTNLVTAISCLQKAILTSNIL